jgi:hypothetical protein
MRLPEVRVLQQELEKCPASVVAHGEVSVKGGGIVPQASDPSFCLRMCDQLYAGDPVGLNNCYKTCY